MKIRRFKDWKDDGKKSEGKRKKKIWEEKRVGLGIEGGVSWRWKDKEWEKERRKSGEERVEGMCKCKEDWGGLRIEKDSKIGIGGKMKDSKEGRKKEEREEEKRIEEVWRGRDEKREEDWRKDEEEEDEKIIGNEI